MKVLVAYASRHGATKGIAERIGTVLANEWLDVRVLDAARVTDLESFDAFVIGSAAYAGGWLDPATTLVRRHEAFLSDRPVWLFSSGPVGPDRVDKQGRDVLKASEPAQFAEFEHAIHPRGKQVFFGAYDPDQEPIGTMETVGAWFMRHLPEAKAALPAGDYRDWDAIEGWARGIARELVREPVASGS